MLHIKDVGPEYRRVGLGLVYKVSALSDAMSWKDYLYPANMQTHGPFWARSNGLGPIFRT